MSRLRTRWRVAVLVALGAWLVHQLRYALAHGDDAAAHAHAHSHQYLDFAGPLLVWAVAAASASWIASLARERDDRQPTPLRSAWLRASAALILIYCVQETGEGLLAPGHPDVIAGVFGSGGWIALPLSILVGAAVALLLRGARAAREAVARARRVDLPRILTPEPLVASRPVARVRRSHVLATKLAGRAPPLPV
jgi:hypothetical protein